MNSSPEPTFCEKSVKSFWKFKSFTVHSWFFLLYIEFYFQMEKLITLMNDQKTGIPLQNKKHLLSTIHSSFSGKLVFIFLLLHSPNFILLIYSIPVVFYKLSGKQRSSWSDDRWLHQPADVDPQCFQKRIKQALQNLFLVLWKPCLKVVKPFSCSAHMSMKFVPFINF